MLPTCRLHVRTEQVERSRDGHAAEVGPAPAPYSQRPTLHFSIANHEHEWNLRLLRFSNFEPDFFISQICFSAEPRGLKLGYDLGNVGPLVVGNRHDRCLNRGEPGWERAAEVFDQNAEEPFDRSHQGSMDHDWLVSFAVFPNVAQLKPLGIIEIDLNG